MLVHGGIQSGKESVDTIAEVLVRRGFGVIAIDMPYFGERDTGLLRSFSEADKHEHLYNRESTYLEWLVQLVKDIGRTIDLLQDHYGVDPDRIGYVGFSRGAQAGFVVVGAEPRLAAAGLMYGGHFDRSETGHLAAACPANYIGRIAPRPLWLLSGEFDGDYDRERSVEPLYRHTGQPTEIHWVENGAPVAPAGGPRASGRLAELSARLRAGVRRRPTGIDEPRKSSGASKLRPAAPSGLSHPLPTFRVSDPNSKIVEVVACQEPRRPRIRLEPQEAVEPHPPVDITPAEPARFRNLTVFPLVSEGSGQPVHAPPRGARRGLRHHWRDGLGGRPHAPRPERGRRRRPRPRRRAADRREAEPDHQPLHHPGGEKRH